MQWSGWALIGLVIGLWGAFVGTWAPRYFWQWLLPSLLLLLTIWLGQRRQILPPAGQALLLGFLLAWGGAYKMRLGMESIVTPSSWQTTVRGRVVDADAKRLRLQSVDTTSLLYLPRLTKPTTTKIDAAAWWGEEVECRVRLRQPRRATLPAGFDAKLYLLNYRRGWHGKVQSGSIVQCRQLTATKATALLPKFRQHFYNLTSSMGTPELRGLMYAMLLADQGQLTPAMKELFRRTGLYHLLVVSGMNLALLGGMVFILISLLLSLTPSLLYRLNRQMLASTLAFAMMVVYLQLVGADAPVVRALSMAGLVLSTIWAGRPCHPVHSLTLVALLLLLYNPFYLLSPSFQLTMSATFGIVAGSYYHGRHCLKRWQQRCSTLPVWCRRLIVMMLAMILASSYAYIFTLPVSCYHFHSMSLWGLLCNFIYTGIIGSVVMPLGFFSLLLTPVHAGSAAWLFKVAISLMQWCLPSLHFFAQLPGSQTAIALPSSLQIAAWYLFWLLLLSIWQWRQQWRWISACAIFLLLSAVPHYPTEQIRATVLDVGNASATVIEYTPHWYQRQVFLMDSGQPSSCESVLQPFLWQRGIRHLDAIYLSHWDNDHAGCLPWLRKNFSLGPIYASYPSPQPQLHSDVSLAHPGEQHDYSPTLQFKLWHDVAAQHASNQRSLVTLLRFQPQQHLQPMTLLFPGDIEKQVELKLQIWWQKHSTAPLTILLAPHHGSKTSSSAALIASLKSQHVIISRRRAAGKGVVERYLQAHSMVYTTRQQGSIMIRLNARGVAIQGFTCTAAGIAQRGWGSCP